MSTVTTGKKPLTTKQREIYDFIKGEITGQRLSPTVREIAEKFGIRSSNGVLCHLRALERKGWIKRDHYLSRGITLVSEPTSQIVMFKVDETLTIGDVSINLMSVVDSGGGFNVMVEVTAPDSMGEIKKH